MAKEEQIKTSIDLTGEKEYRAACTNINSSLREIGSEMKLTTAEFADNADSVEALTAKQKLLQKQFDEQAKKAEAAEKALKPHYKYFGYGYFNDVKEEDKVEAYIMVEVPR